MIALTVFMIGGVVAIWANVPLGQVLFTVGQPTARLRARATTFKTFYARLLVIVLGGFISGACGAGLVGLLPESPQGPGSPFAQHAIGVAGMAALAWVLIRRVPPFVLDARDAARAATGRRDGSRRRDGR